MESPRKALRVVPTLLRKYFSKWQGDNASVPPVLEMRTYIALAVLGAFLSIGFVACLGYLSGSTLMTPIGSMGELLLLLHHPA